ncbi:MAG: polysaccharide deacetylase family protein [Chloroflexi bacterium]|nr:polysaccharide deacetylase family protein [Chloroflexota bacterium]
MKKNLILTLGIILLLTACGGTPSTPTPLPTFTVTPLPPTVTASVTPTSSSTPTLIPSPIPTATWVKQGPDAVKVPILLYHRIDYSETDNRYYITPERFEDQMRLLRDWEYTSITTEMLVRAITDGVELPPRPVLITIDDGNLDNYTHAFPIMQKYGFTGVLYLVYNYVGYEGYMNKEQILEMVDAGWEVGSHSMNHFDLKTISPAQQRNEIVESRELLEKLLGIPVKTFAYPFGSRNATSYNYVHFAKYIAAMGADGFTADQGLGNLFSLQRSEIKGTEDAKTFIRFLPWHGDPAYLPTDTPTPSVTPTWTPKPTWTAGP